MQPDICNPVLALSGGVGGAKLVLGLSKILRPECLSVVANTADDFCHLGLPISPDLDTLMYTLAGVANRKQGWGIKGETWHTLDALRMIGADTWFQLGDKDLATHLRRLSLLNQGLSLTEVTRILCQTYQLGARLLPMSDDPVQTIVQTADTDIPFQEYFVERRCEPVVTGFRFQGIESAKPSEAVLAALQGSAVSCIVICPSNPFVSVAPILSLRGMVDALNSNPAPVVVVSPIVSGQAIKGPTAKMMRELDIPVTALEVFRYYKDKFGLEIDGAVIDTVDADLGPEIEQLTRVVAVPTVMRTLDDRIGLATSVLDFASRLKARK